MNRFDQLEQKVASNNGENALLGNGIQLFNKGIETIKSFDTSELVRLNGGDTTLPDYLDYQNRKTAVNGSIDSVLNFDRVEEILSACTAPVLERLDPAMVKNALRLESQAAVLGNEITKKQGFLHQVLTANISQPPTETTARFGVVIHEEKLGYTEGEVEAFKKLFDNLQEQYKNIQGQLSGIKKTIKDTIRMVDIEFAKEYEAYLQAYNTRQSEIIAKQNQIAAQGESLRQQLIQEFLTLKIQID